MTTLYLNLTAIFFYLFALMVVVTQLFFHNNETHLQKNKILGISSVATLLHISVLYQSIVTSQGLLLDLFNMFSLVSALMMAMLLLTMLRRPVENLTLVLLPVAIIALSLRLLTEAKSSALIQHSSELQLHILLSVVAFSLLSIAAIQAILLAVQERHLRNHRPSGFIRALPPMESMETLLFQVIYIGFVMLTLALFNGLLTLQDMFAQHLVHKTILSLSAWLVFATLIWGRWRYGWRGRTAIRWTLTGLITLLMAYFGSKIVLELILQR
ncbi:MAG: cytochrome c biogenesis protein CcsA [Gammaproteobacteria bacterium]|nr:cytochrome c biogenesis protein CcsA [Gammaproteobacteria bacterium]